MLYSVATNNWIVWHTFNEMQHGVATKAWMVCHDSKMGNLLDVRSADYFWRLPKYVE